MAESEGPVILYTSNRCGQSRMVETFLREHVSLLEVVNIDGDPEARSRLIEINGGYASVPTVILPDGRRLTEPPLYRLRQELGIEGRELGERVRRILGGSS
jgi:mycoredoxin